MIRNKYGLKIECKYFDPVWQDGLGYMCKFDTYTHNGFLDCDERGNCVFNMANKLKNREGSWGPKFKNQREMNEYLDKKMLEKLKEVYGYDPRE